MNDRSKQQVCTPSASLLAFRSPVTFSLSAAGLFVVLFNYRFWQESIAAFWHGSLMDGLFLLALLVVLLLIHAGALLLLPGRWAMIVITGFLVPVSAMAAFCADSFGLPIDKEMIRSIGETDRGEALSLFSPRLAFYAVGLGVLPMFLVGGARIAPLGVRRDLLHRLMFYAAGLTLAAMLVWAFAPRFDSFCATCRCLAPPCTGRFSMHTPRCAAQSKRRSPGRRAIPCARRGRVAPSPSCCSWWSAKQPAT